MTLSKKLFLGVCAVSLAACTAAEQSSTETPAAEAPAATAAASDATAPITIDTSYTDAPSGLYTNDKTHAYIVFNYAHQGFSKPFLRWRDWDSTLNWNSEDPTKSSVAVKIDAASIDTGVDVFDGHLVSDQWFDVETYPEITFQSTSLEKTSDTQGKMTGDLTLKGITKPVTLDVTFNRAAEGREPGTYKIGFSARTELKRSDFDLGAYVPVVGDDVDVIIEVEYGLTPAAE